jgi:hypothetical protein
MTTKLVQKNIIKGTQELELIEDYVNIRTKAPFKDEERHTVMLTVLNPEPVISKSSLVFNSRVNGCPLITLYLGKPNTEEFNAFVSALKQRALEEFSAFAGLRPPGTPPEIEANVDEPPPEFEESAEERIVKSGKRIDGARVENAIELLKAQMDTEEIKPFVTALEALKDAPDNRDLLVKVLHAFNELGSNQGPVLAYAPYVSILLSDDPFETK